MSPAGFFRDFWLFMASHIRQGSSGERIPVAAGAESEVVISLYCMDGLGTP